MVKGIIVACIASGLWIVAQNVCMHFWPTQRRLRAMTYGVCAGLPLLVCVYWFLPLTSPANESPYLGPMQAIIAYVLLFAGYAEFFYHVERSVTIRILVELIPYGGAGTTVDAIKTSYPQEDMIFRRLQVLEKNGFVRHQQGGWKLTAKGAILADGVAVALRVFGAQTQADRG